MRRLAGSVLAISACAPRPSREPAAPLRTRTVAPGVARDAAAGTTAAPPSGPGGCPVVRAALTANHGCAIATDGGVYCWGDDADGQLGVGRREPHAEPVEVPGTRGASELALGFGRSCARYPDGTFRCWGRNYERPDHAAFWTVPSGPRMPRPMDLGGDPTPAEVLVATPVPAMAGLTRVAFGDFHVCGLDPEARVRCWGENGWGQLGNGNTGVVSGTPTPVDGLAGVAELRLAMHTTCARMDDGTVRCWGQDQSRALTDPLVGTPWTPRAIVGVTDAVQLAVGSLSACAVLRDGGVRCWGSNVGAGLGDGTQASRGAAVPVRDVADAVQVGVGTGGGCALLRDGTARCWGEDLVARLGDGTFARPASPTRVPGLTDGAEILVAGRQVCAVRRDRSLACLVPSQTYPSRAAALVPMALPPCRTP